MQTRQRSLHRKVLDMQVRTRILPSWSWHPPTKNRTNQDNSGHENSIKGQIAWGGRSLAVTPFSFGNLRTVLSETKLWLLSHLAAVSEAADGLIAFPTTWLMGAGEHCWPKVWGWLLLRSRHSFRKGKRLAREWYLAWLWGDFIMSWKISFWEGCRTEK